MLFCIFLFLITTKFLIHFKIYIGIKAVTSTMVYYYQSCSSSCSNVNLTFDDIFYMNLCCQTDNCNVYPRNNLPTASPLSTEAELINSTTRYKNSSSNLKYEKLKIVFFLFCLCLFQIMIYY
jgi:hypothetical protein